ncbi:MAG: helix-turn-helix transcriptional regulator [Pseudomonadota bacterium]|nr:helix-turn-helix transcriptional regulator [Pseudomonadota bacterium]
MSPDWLRSLGVLDPCSDGMQAHGLAPLCARHLALRYWSPTASALVLVEQMLQPPAGCPALQALYRESRALDMWFEVFRTLPAQEGYSAPAKAEASVPAHVRLDTRTWQRMCALRAWLSSEDAQHQALDEVAQRAGMHGSTMQRQFRAAFGVSIGDFMRESRLQRARLTLESEAISVKEAAALAGYGSAANFATAYKRRFGLTPKQARLRGND